MWNDKNQSEIYNWKEKNNRKCRFLFLAIALLAAGFVTGTAVYRAQQNVQAQTQEHLAQEVLRFHVLANSDSEEDQELKLFVRDAVLAYLEKEMPTQMDVGQTKLWIREHVREIEQTGLDAVVEQGYDYPVNAAVTTCWFPDKTYGDLTFPQGNYEALRVEIGAAKGHNWWCVLYPGLCFMDSVNAVVPEEGKEKLQKVLTEEEYAKITVTDKFEIKWYFLELFADRE